MWMLLGLLIIPIALLFPTDLGKTIGKAVASYNKEVYGRKEGNKKND